MTGGERDYSAERAQKLQSELRELLSFRPRDLSSKWEDLFGQYLERLETFSEFDNQSSAAAVEDFAYKAEEQIQIPLSLRPGSEFFHRWAERMGGLISKIPGTESYRNYLMQATAYSFIRGVNVGSNNSRIIEGLDETLGLKSRNPAGTFDREFVREKELECVSRIETKQRAINDIIEDFLKRRGRDPGEKVNFLLPSFPQSDQVHDFEMDVDVEKWRQELIEKYRVER